jgi:hypothetical protein
MRPSGIFLRRLPILAPGAPIVKNDPGSAYHANRDAAHRRNRRALDGIRGGTSRCSPRDRFPVERTRSRRTLAARPVRDALIDGIGSGQVSLISAFPVSAPTGGLEMNSGSQHRYLAEAVWYPSALLPSSQLQWTPIHATKALATLRNDRASVSLEFRFGDSGEVTGIYTPARWGTFASGYKQVPWEGHFRDYREQDGVVVPTHGEVGWYIDDEWRAVWKGTVAAYQIQVRE